MPSEMLVCFVRYSGGAIKGMEDAALATLCANTHAHDWSLRMVDNWDAREPLAALWNRVIDESTNPYVCLLNSDCFVGPGWDVGVLAALSQKTVGAVGPYANQGQQCAPDGIADGDGTAPGQLTRMARLCRERFAGQIRDARLYGFCLTVARTAWRAAGGFDPAVPLYGNEEIFLERMKAKGWRAVIAQDSFAWHVGEASARVAQFAGRISVDAERERGRMALADETRRLATQYVDPSPRAL